MNADRIARVRAVLAAADRVHHAQSSLYDALISETGLSREGVILGFADHWERADELRADELLSAVAEASIAYVVLAANVFVAPVRALCLAAAAAPTVRVRASRRAGTIPNALLAELADAAWITALGDDRLQDAPVGSASAVLHAYGSDATIDALSTQFPGRVEGHGHGFGVAWIGAEHTDLDKAAAALARDIVPFDQSGCLSPRVAIVEGAYRRRTEFAEALDAALTAEALTTPRGVVDRDLRKALDQAAFLGDLREGTGHAIWLPDDDQPLGNLLPSGRNIALYAAHSVHHARVHLAPVSRYITTVGSATIAHCTELGATRARPAALGQMQRPPFDGPVDRRAR